MKYKNITVKQRDITVFKLLSKIKIIKSHTLYDLVAIKKTKYWLASFLRRIKQLKDKWYIQDVKWDIRGEQILRLNKNKFKIIEEYIWSEIYKWNIDTSNYLYTHEWYISKALLYIKDKSESQLKSKLNIDNFISQYYLYNLINSNTNLLEKNVLKKIMINDWMINIWNTSYLIEVEINALNKAKSKFEWYKKMEIFYEKIREKYDFFQGNVTICIFCHSYKLEKYKKIINDVKLQKFKVKFITLESLKKDKIKTL